jgi:hypothetical protein
VKLATENQEHTNHKTQIKNKSLKKKNEVQDRFDKQMEKKRIGFLHAMIMKVPPKTLVFFFGNP